MNTKPVSARSRSTKIDKAIGNRIREIRLARGMSQTTLAEALGVKFQQVQKYENGSNALASSRVINLCHALQITPDQLYRITVREAAEVSSLSNFAVRIAGRVDKLSNIQRNAVVAVIDAFQSEGIIA